MDRCHLTCVQTHRMYNSKSDPNVNYGLWVIVMCLCRCINYNKCTIWRDVDNVGGCAHVGEEQMGNLCTSHNFAVNLKCL